MALSGTKRIVEYTGTVYDTLTAADSVTKVIDKLVLSAVGDRGDITYDQVVAGFYVPDMTQISTVAGEGAVDSVIMRLIVGTDANNDTLVSATKAALPATFNITYSADSAGIFRHKLYNEHIWFSAYCVDSAGTHASDGDSLLVQITYWIKLIERD
jgi:hypothetical protein